MDRHALWSVVVWVIAACGTNTPSSSQGVVGPAGGQVAIGDTVVIDIPAGALASNTTITATATEAAAPPNTVAAATPYLLGPEGTQFAVPVTLTLAFASSSADIVIYTAPANTTAYQAMPTTVVDASHVRAQTTHFSIFAAAAPIANDEVDATTSSDAGGTTSSDAATTTCTPVMAGGAQACTFTATCDGHTYKAQCAGADCTCITDGVTGMQVENVGTTCSHTTGQPGWGVCGFP